MAEITASELMKLFQSMPKKEQDKFLGRVVPETPIKHSSENTLEKYVADERFKGGWACPHCGSVSVIRFGKLNKAKALRTPDDGEPKQRFKCKDCGKIFISTTNSVTRGTHFDIDTWREYIRCMCLKLSLRETAEICGISLHTAFRWRHKILDTLQGLQDTIVLDGISELDETFFPISYKGNYGKGMFKSKFGRKPHKRGKSGDFIVTTDKDGKEVVKAKKKKRGLSKDLVCVPCGVDRNGQSYGKVGKLGKVSTECVEKAFDGHLSEDAVLCTDKEKAYKIFENDYDLPLIQLHGTQVLKGIYHIQHINNYHSQLKKFIENFYGVATKYLNNYIVWHNQLYYSDFETLEEKEKALMRYVFTALFEETNAEMEHRPSLPLLVE